MLHILPIAITTVDWRSFSQLAKQVLGRSVTQSLDDRKSNMDSLASYIAMLGEFKCEGTTPSHTLREAGSLLQHVHASFVVICSQELMYQLAIEGILSISEVPTIKQGFRGGVVSGTLEDWRTSIINGCSELADPELRELFNVMLLHFDKIGLSELWILYRRVTMTDGTFKLLPKP